MLLKDTSQNKIISSAEMTAYWRCAYPQWSQDKLSQKLIPQNSVQLANNFIARLNYPLLYFYF